MTPNSEIRYFDHYEEGRISRSLPAGSGEEVLQSPDARYYDTLQNRTLRNRFVAVKRIYVLGAYRDVAAVYEIENNITWLVTIFPLKEGQQRNRLQRGRWELLNEPKSELCRGA